MIARNCKVYQFISICIAFPGLATVENGKPFLNALDFLGLKIRNGARG